MSSPATLLKEALSALRRKIRAPLHQIISYAEIIAEESGEEKNQLVSAALSAIIIACESVLLTTAGFQANTEPAESFIEKLRKHLLEQCGTLLALSEQLQKNAPAERFASLQPDIKKLNTAVVVFKTLANEITSDKVFALAPPARAFNSESSSQQWTEHQSLSSQPVSAAGSSGKAIRGGVVLVVDDDEGNRDVLSRRLLRDGCEVMLAETGRQALRMAHRYGFDLILLDIMMPEMDGIMVLSELKKAPALRHLPVIMISAVDEVESVVRCIELGADDYLPKPFNPIILRARVNALLERKRLQDEEIRKTAELEKALLEIEQQRKKTEELLLNILPSSVAQELQTNGCVQPMYFEDVTIAFADFVGFTLATEQLPADDLVSILSRYFTAFDNIMKRYNLEKLKTIGDCYMFVGGLPLRTPSHPVDTILAAFEMLRVSNELAKEGPVAWQLRIGVHTGPVVAGVVGIHKFTFDIWGDAVNFSSRMEASGAPGRVNLSASTYTRIKDFFSCEKRGEIKIKDGREVEMYFVNGIATGLQLTQKMEAVTGTNAQPLKSFQQRYRNYFRKDLQAFPEFLAEQTS
ncbi:MAG TPA: adenylate/guanylate cyclase domain-containing protein [Candidatus Angelobacter sp.]|jgi:class 3 adenylate cyclase